jgi:DNA-binding transcriptional ArsR family regulator
MLNEIFVSEVRVKILKLMLPAPEKPFHVRALVRAVGTEINAIRRELNRLTKLGLLKRRPSGNRVYFTVNTSSVYYPELLSLISKESGLGQKIIQQAKALGDVRFAMLSRAFSRGRNSTILDIDLFIVGSLNLEVLEKIISEEEKSTGKEVHYSVMGEDEFLFRKRKNDQFVMRILTQSRTMLLGDEEEFCSLS